MKDLYGSTKDLYGLIKDLYGSMKDLFGSTRSMKVLYGSIQDLYGSVRVFYASSFVFAACSCLIACKYLHLDDISCRSGAKFCYLFMALILHLCQDPSVEMSACNLFRVVQLRYV